MLPPRLTPRFRRPPPRSQRARARQALAGRAASRRRRPARLGILACPTAPDRTVGASVKRRTKHIAPRLRVWPTSNLVHPPRLHRAQSTAAWPPRSRSAGGRATAAREALGVPTYRSTPAAIAAWPIKLAPSRTRAARTRTFSRYAAVRSSAENRCCSEKVWSSRVATVSAAAACSRDLVAVSTSGRSSKISAADLGLRSIWMRKLSIRASCSGGSSTRKACSCPMARSS